MLGMREPALLFGLGVRSQNVSGTKKKSRNQQAPTIIVTILIQSELIDARPRIRLPKDPSPAHGIDNRCRNKRNKVLAAQQQERIYANAEGALMQKENFGDSSRWQTFDWTDSHPLQYSRNSEGHIRWRCSTPHSCSNEEKTT